MLVSEECNSSGNDDYYTGYCISSSSRARLHCSRLRLRDILTAGRLSGWTSWLFCGAILIHHHATINCPMLCCWSRCSRLTLSWHCLRHSRIYWSSPNLVPEHFTFNIQRWLLCTWPTIAAVPNLHEQGNFTRVICCRMMNVSLSFRTIDICLGFVLLLELS